MAEQTATTHEGQAKPSTADSSSSDAPVIEQEPKVAEATEETATDEKSPGTRAAGEKPGEEAASDDEAAKPEDKADESKEEESKPPEGAPEEYEITSPLPDGAKLDPGVLKAFLDVARERGFTNDIAQEMVDKVVPALQAQTSSAIEATHQQWETTLKDDPDIGGEKLTETLRSADRFLDAFPAGEAIRKVLDATGFRGHPEFVRLFDWGGRKLIPESKVLRGDPSVGDDPRLRDPIDRLADSYAKRD